MAKTYLRLDTRRALKDGKYPIVLVVGYGRNMYISTDVSSAPDDWDENAQLFTGKGAKAVNAVLKTMLATTVSRILELRENGTFDKLDNKQLKAMLQNPDADTAAPNVAGKSVGDMFAAVMAAKSKRTAEIYASTMVRLRSYCDVDKLNFESINKLWLDGFVGSMSELSPNTKSIHLRNLRAVINYAIDCDVTANYPFRRYKMPVQTSRKRSLGVEVLRNLAALPLGHNGVYRDLFMLTFFLIGINFVDLCGLARVDGGRVEYIRAKTHKPYSVKVEPEAQVIIERLRGRGQLLMMLDNHKDYRSYYRQLRRGLEAVRSAYNLAHPDAAIDELTTYWARHSWATVAASLDIPKETIAAALGHEMGNSVTAIYIDFDRRKVDEANRRVIDWVLYEKK